MRTLQTLMKIEQYLHWRRAAVCDGGDKQAVFQRQQKYTNKRLEITFL